MEKQYEVKFAYNTLVYAGENIADGIRTIARYGYDGAEFIGEPDELDANIIKSGLKSNNVEASSICSLYNTKRDLVSSSKKVRKHTVESIRYVKPLFYP